MNKPVTPQVPTSAQLSGFVQVAADSVASLRRQDVERVISETPAHFRLAVALYITCSRLDLREEVDAIMETMK